MNTTKLSERLSEKLGSLEAKSLEKEIGYDFSRPTAPESSDLRIETPKYDKDEPEIQNLSEQIHRLKVGIWIAFGIAFFLAILLHGIVTQDLAVLKTNSSPKMAETIAAMAVNLESAQKTIETLKGRGDVQAAATAESLSKALETLTSVRKDLDELKQNTAGFEKFQETADETIRLLATVDQDFKRLLKEPVPEEAAASA